MKLFIGNLPYNISESEINELCAGYGEVVSTNLVQDRFTGQSKGFAFVEMSTRSGGQQAMESLNKMTFQNRQLVCNEAKPKKKGKFRR